METLRYEPTPAWEHALSTPDCTCHLLLVVDNGERIVGWCRVFPDNVSKLETQLGIGLLPEYRNRHIGTTLIQKSIDWAQKHQLERIRLRVHHDNERAIHVFSKLGFIPVVRSKGGWLEMMRTLK